MRARQLDWASGIDRGVEAMTVSAWRWRFFPQSISFQSHDSGSPRERLSWSCQMFVESG
jgi:hypothetical protein